MSWLNVWDFKQKIETNSTRKLYGITAKLSGGQMWLELNTRINQETGQWRSGSPDVVISGIGPIPVGRWSHWEVRYLWDTDNGRITFWLDGKRMFDVSGIRTEMPRVGEWVPKYEFDRHRELKINLYGAGLSPGTYTSYIDDVIIAGSRQGP